MKRLRVSWLVVIVVAGLTLMVPALRDQLQLGLASLVHRSAAWPLEPFALGMWEGHLWDELGERRDLAAEFVSRQYPDDADMLAAAGMLTADVDRLREAAQKADSPAAWAAYVGVLSEEVPRAARIGCWRPDPEDEEEMAEAEQHFASVPQSDRLTPENSRAMIEALRAWQKVDPGNGLPHALEAYYLYGLHEDDAAFRAWTRAAQISAVTERTAERQELVRRLLVAMDMPEPEALVATASIVEFETRALVRDLARISYHEARVAQLAGRPADAVTWWANTASFAEHIEDSADTMIEWLVGSAVLQAGAGPVWVWCVDQERDPGAPLRGGRLYHGGHYQFYVDHAGVAAAENMRDVLARSVVRGAFLRRHIWPGMDADFEASRGYLHYAGGLALGILGFLAVTAAVSLWSRRPADGAIRMRPLWLPLLTALTVLPVVLGALFSPMISEHVFFRDLELMQFFSNTYEVVEPLFFVGPPMVSLLVGLVLTFIAATLSRAPGAHLLTAWRGYMRRVFPSVGAVLALIFLALSISAMNMRAGWVREMTSPGLTEMSWTIDQIGAEWHDPTIPPGSWVDSLPPPREAAPRPTGRLPRRGGAVPFTPIPRAP